MSYQFTVSDDTYQRIASLAAERGKTAAEFIGAILNEAEILAGRAEYDTLFAEAYATPQFQQRLQQALNDVATGKTTVFHSAEEFDAALDAIPFRRHKIYKQT